MRLRVRSALVVVATAASLTATAAQGHPLGNFSINHYSGLHLRPESVVVRYVIDMAEIPTFQELQARGVAPDAGSAGARDYASTAAEALKNQLHLDVGGRRLALETTEPGIAFVEGAAGLPTMRLTATYHARLEPGPTDGVMSVHYRDANFPARIGWKEIVAVGEGGAAIIESTVPGRGRSQELREYPSDLISSPPQDLTAEITFSRIGMPTVAAAGASPVASRTSTPRDAFTQLMGTRELTAGIVLLAAAVAVGAGALHALEPGHGKTVVGAYLVGAKGTAKHAVVLGLIVTLSHTMSVYMLGAVTLYASRYVVPERLYPWLSAVSGLTIAMLGIWLFLRHHSVHGHSHGHGHDHVHAHGDVHGHDHMPLHSHDDSGDDRDPADRRGAGGHHHPHGPSGDVSLRALFALGVTGGIVPCPAALIVLLSAVALGRIGFGLLLIVAFSLGLAAVLIAIGLMMVYAGRFMARLSGEGRLVTRYLPLTSAALITVLGIALVVRALASAGVVQIKL